MLSLPFYLLLTISIVSKCANAYVLDGSVSMNNEDKSQTDEKQSASFDGSSSTIRSTFIARNANDADNQIATSTSNVTVIDNSIDMPKPNDATDNDAITYQTSRESRNTLTEVETGTVHPFSFSLSFCCPLKKKSIKHYNDTNEMKKKHCFYPIYLRIDHFFSSFVRFSHFDAIGIEFPLNKK